MASIRDLFLSYFIWVFRPFKMHEYARNLRKDSDVLPFSRYAKLLSFKQFFVCWYSVFLFISTLSYIITMIGVENPYQIDSIIQLLASIDIQLTVRSIKILIFIFTIVMAPLAVLFSYFFLKLGTMAMVNIFDLDSDKNASMQIICSSAFAGLSLVNIINIFIGSIISIFFPASFIFTVITWISLIFIQLFYLGIGIYKNLKGTAFQSIAGALLATFIEWLIHFVLILIIVIIGVIGFFLLRGK